MRWWFEKQDAARRTDKMTKQYAHAKAEGQFHLTQLLYKPRELNIIYI